MAGAHSPKQNGLLAALPDDAYARLTPHLEWVEMPFGRELHGSARPSGRIYFPTTSIVSLLQVLDRTSAAIALVGCEGMVGLELFIGGARTPDRAVVQCAGEGIRMEARFLTVECERAGPVLDVVLHYTRSLIAQMVKAALCNRQHSVEQRFCRWLLSSLDRSTAGIRIDLELFADLMGVRPDVMAAHIRRLESHALVRSSGHQLELLDRAGIERLSCECYASSDMER